MLKSRQIWAPDADGGTFRRRICLIQAATGGRCPGRGAGMRRVLFVDDQDDVLSGLRRMLHGLRGQWQMSFLPNSDAALLAMAQEPVDVLVTDMHMFGMDGASLLGEVRRRWPETVRIVLTGYADEGAALRSISVAHRFLSKPCEAGVLSATIQGACEIQERLSRPELRRLIGGLGGLPSPPRLFTKITKALEQPDVGMDQVAEIIERDPGCAAKLLQLVNSAFFGLARTVTQVRDAVSYLGITRVRDVVLAAEVADVFRLATPELVKVTEAVSERSSRVAQLARESAPSEISHEVFIAGLLHDVGRLVFAAATPKEYAALLREYQRAAEAQSADPSARPTDLAAWETERFGANHAEVGAYLLRLWGLPLTLIDPVARHHDPDAISDDNPIVSAIARTVAVVEGSGCGTGSGSGSGSQILPELATGAEVCGD